MSQKNKDRIIKLLENPKEEEEGFVSSICRKCAGKVGNDDEEQENESREVELGKRNKWFRETVSTDSLIWP